MNRVVSNGGFLWDFNAADYLSLVAFLFTLVEIYRTRRIADKTKKAVETAAARVSLYNVLLAVPELTRLESEIQRAAVDDMREDARRLLTDWREAASDLRGVLVNENVSNEELDSLINDSIAKVMLATNQLTTPKTGTVLARTEQARKSIQQVCVETRSLAALIRSSSTSLGNSPTDNVRVPRPVSAKKDPAITRGKGDGPKNG